VVRVVPDVPAITRRFDYTVPEALSPAGPLRPGTRVRVALHGRRVGAWVVDQAPDPPPGVELAPLLSVSGLGPPPAVVGLAEWAAWRWAGPVASFLRTASPPRIVTGLPAAPAPGSWSLAERPAPAGGHHHPRLADVGSARPTVVRLPPDADLLPLLADVVEDARRSARGPVLVLAPSLAGAERLAGRLADRGVPVARSADQWARAAAGWPVVVGARAAAWAPLPGLGAAVVLDAHDEAYREERAPTFDAGAVVAERAARAGAPCLWVSPCPTAVQLAQADLWVPPRDLERRGWPALTVVDRRSADPRSGLYSEELVRAVSDSLDRSAGPTSPYVCVINRTGRARLLACAGCGELTRCEHCGRPVEQVVAEPAPAGRAGEAGEGPAGRLVCRHCGAERPVVCAGCGRTRLKALRVGVSRVREELEALFGRPVGEVSGPAAEVPAAAVLVGTEAVLHRVRRAAGVAFLDFDQHLLAARFVAHEEALGLVARAARLVGGRARGAGRVLVQTRLPDHPVLAAAVHGDPGRLAGPERALRAELDLPPASALALVTGQQAAELAQALAAGPAGLEVAALGEGRWLVRAPDHRRLCDGLAAADRPRRVRVEVDPVSL
jgi:primosomal protein N' (replication factor Y)